MRVILWIGLCVNLWLTLGYFVFAQNVGDQSLASPAALLTCALWILAPGLTFIPVATYLRARLYDLEATIGWATLGFVLTFIPPSEPLSRGQFLAILLPLTVAIASLTTLVAYATIRRLAGGLPHPGQFLQARREGYLAAVALVALLLLHSVGVLTPFNGALTITIAVLVEALALARQIPSSAS